MATTISDVVWWERKLALAYSVQGSPISVLAVRGGRNLLREAAKLDWCILAVSRQKCPDSAAPSSWTGSPTLLRQSVHQLRDLAATKGNAACTRIQGR